MLRRTTALLGAGAILDFDFKEIVVPTTKNITKAVVEQKIQGYDGRESVLIKHIYNTIVEVSRTAYLKSHFAVRQYEPKISFEDLFNVIETLFSYNGTWKQEQYPIPLVSALVKSDLQFETIEYYRALIAIIEKIFDIVYAYDEQFKEADREIWYKDFWKRFSDELDVFNLNYDTTVESSLGDYVDGYVGFTQDYERFEPEALWNASPGRPTVNHLHGCILYGDVNPQPVEFYYSHRDLYKFYPDVAKKVFISGQWAPRNQVGDTIVYSPIITGLKKTDKICYMPHSIYHANLVKKIIENPSLLIIGYSFGDLYINQLLQRHKLIHDKKEKVIVIDKWPDYVNEDGVDLYRYYMDNTSSGFREFVGRITESGIAPLETFKQFKQISKGCWQSPNGILRLYTKGLKYAVETQEENVLNYLQEAVV